MPLKMRHCSDCDVFASVGIVEEECRAFAGLRLPMVHKSARFSVGDLVFERFPFASAARERGVVIKTYEFANEYRYVVKFDSGREDVFFERELLPRSPDVGSREPH
jgi:hypothetical protein